MHKLPFIEDKNLFLAVKRACRWIAQKGGYFNVACRWCAKEYGVDEEEVRRYVSLAAANGQRIANAKKAPRKYQWFAIEYSRGRERDNCDFFTPEDAQYVTAKGLTKETVLQRFYWDDVSEDDLLFFIGRVKGFQTQAEAMEQCEKWHHEQLRHYALWANLAGSVTTATTKGFKIEPRYI